MVTIRFIIITMIRIPFLDYNTAKRPINSLTEDKLKSVWVKWNDWLQEQHSGYDKNKNASSLLLSEAFFKQLTIEADVSSEIFSINQDLLQAFIENERRIKTPISHILTYFDWLLSIEAILKASSSHTIFENIKTIRNYIVENYYTGDQSTNSRDQVFYDPFWLEEYREDVAPDLRKITAEILWLLIDSTHADQAFLFLGDFPLQSYTPFLAIGRLTLQQKRAFSAENLRPETDILLSELMRERKPLSFDHEQLIKKYPSFLFQQLGISSAVALPILFGERLLGFLILNKSPNPLIDSPPFSNQTIRSAMSIISALGLALENSRLYEITNQRLLETQSINQINLVMLQTYELQKVLDTICENAIKLTQGLGSAIHLLDKKNELLELSSFAGFLIHNERQSPIAESFLRAALDKNEAVLINKSVIEQNFSDGAKYSVLAVPLKIHGKLVGVLDIIKKQSKFSPDDIRIIQIFSDQASIAIEHANLYHQAGQAAKLEERNKMARNLHDSVNQNLYAILLQTRAIKKLIQQENSEKATRILDELKSTTKEALNELRIFIHELRPPVLENEGLINALRLRLNAVEEKLGFEIVFIAPEDFPEISIEIQEAYYRIAQEALNNIIKHAKASQVLMKIQITNQKLVMQIRDDGVGLPKPGKMGYGLSIIKERSELIRADLHIKSENGTGTELVIEVEI